MDSPLIYRRPQLCRTVGVGFTTIHRWMREGRFPRPIALGAKAKGWVAAEIDAWLAERQRERDAGDAKAS